jgi:hypothetical protein
MPVERGGPAARGGVYAAVRERVEADARAHKERVGTWPPAWHPYPMQRVLDALRSGDATDVPAWAIPRIAECSSPWRLWAAIVRSDDTVTFDVDDGPGLWLEYQGLQ